MKTVLQITVPPILAIGVIVGLLELEGFLNQEVVQDTSGADVTEGFFWNLLLPSIMVLLVLLQAFLVLPIKRRILDQYQDKRLRTLKAIVILSITIGTILGLLLWDRHHGLKDLINAIGIMILGQAVYWTINFWTLERIKNATQQRL